jgi:hypothetical protein
MLTAVCTLLVAGGCGARDPSEHPDPSGVAAPMGARLGSACDGGLYAFVSSCERAALRSPRAR